MNIQSWNSQKKPNKTWKDVVAYSQEVRWDEDFDYLDLSSHAGQFVEIRFFGPYFVAARHWPKFMTKSGEKKTFPEWCLNFNSETENFEDHQCPYCALDIGAQKTYFTNVIMRSLQENKPSNVKADWSPVKILNFGIKVANQVISIIALNKHKIDGKNVDFAVEDIQYGCDLFIKFDPQAPGSDKYTVQKGNHTPLTEEEMQYTLTDVAAKYKTKTLDVLRRDISRLSLVDMEGNTIDKTPLGLNAVQPVAGTKRSSSGLLLSEDDDIPAQPKAPSPVSAPPVNSAMNSPQPVAPTVQQAASAPVAAAPQPAQPAVQQQMELPVAPPAKPVAPPVSVAPTPAPVAPTPAPVAAAPAKVAAAAAATVVSGDIMQDFMTKNKLKSKVLEDNRTVPECYGFFDGKMKCFKCPLKKECSDISDTE